MVTEAQLHDVTAEDHAKITKAIREVEAKTSGEVFAVVAHQSDDYFYVAGFMAAVWALALGAAMALASILLNYPVSALMLALAQLASFGLTMVLFWFFPALRMFFVPRSLAYKRASNNAVRQFLAHGIHTTQDRSGVLLFISLAEHYAEVVADEGINSKVEQAVWDGMVETLVSHAAKGDVASGFVEAIGQAGKLLVEHFPPTKGQKNELNDRLVEL